MNEDEEQAPRAEPDLPIPEECGATSLDDGQTILGLLAEMMVERERQQEEIERALDQEAQCLGTFVSGMTESENTLDGADLLDQVLQENLIPGLIGTWDARVNQGRIEPRASPTQADRQDVGGGDASQMVLDYERQRLGTDDLCHEAAKFAQYHGDVLFYLTHREDYPVVKVRRQIKDPQGVPMFDGRGMPLLEVVEEKGGLFEELIRAPDYWTSGEENYEQAQYLGVCRIINRYDAHQLLLSARFADTNVTDGTAVTENGDRTAPRRGVETYEIWFPHGARFENGLRAVIVDGRVVKATKHPHEHGELPGAVFKIETRPRSSRGRSHVEDALPMQRLLNRTLVSIARRTRDAGDAYTIGPAEIIQHMRRGGRHIESEDRQIKDRIAHVSGDELPAELFETYRLAKAGEYDAFGISQTSASGGDPNDSTSGRQLEVQNANDSQKIVGPRRKLEKARLRVDRQKLRMWQERARAGGEAREQLIRVLGPDGVALERFIRYADIQGADVTLEIAPGQLNTKVAQKRLAEEEGAAGRIDPQEASERARTGLPTTVGEQEQRQRVSAQAQQAGAGQPQEPIPGVPPRLAVEVILAELASALDGPPEGRRALLALLAKYEEAMQAAAKAASQAKGQGQPQQKKPGGGGMKPTETSALAREAQQ